VITLGLTEANAYFASRINSDTWDAATDANKTKAMTTSERQLEPYRYRVDTTRFYYAIYEQALWLLTGDSRAVLQQAGVQSMSIGKLSETYKSTSGRDPAIAPQAWVFLRGPTLKAGGLR
jgi:hypothetical protein